MNKNRIFNEKGITLIALVVSIIVLLILAGVSIAILTGENGLLNRATSAKQTHEEKTAEEELRLGISALTIDYRSNTTNTGTFRDYVMANTQALANAMGVDANELSMDTDNYAVTYKGQTYTITDDGKLEPFVLVPLTAFNIVEESLEVAEGEAKKLTIQKTPSNANERIVWTSSDNTIATVDANGNVTGVKNGTQTATISAVSKSGNVSSSTSCVVTVTKSLGYFKTIVTNQTTGDGVAYYFSSPSATNGTPIDANNMGQFLGMKVNYIPTEVKTVSGTTIGTGKNGSETEGTYRLFYIDVNGNFETKGTIYLKADDDENGVKLSELDVATGTTKLQQFNKKWWEDEIYCNNPSYVDYNNRISVNKLLDPSKWIAFKDNAGIANYVVGAPTLEMWIDSYNSFLISNLPSDWEYNSYKYNCTTTPNVNGTSTTNDGAGYFVGIGETYTNNGLRTDSFSIANPSSYDSEMTAADRIETWNKGFGNYWLASPSSNNSDLVMCVSGDKGYINRGYYNNAYYSFCPIVCCNSGVAISEAE